MQLRGTLGLAPLWRDSRCHQLATLLQPAAACAAAPPHCCVLLTCGLATCTLSPLQVADWGPKIESIVEWFGQLQEVDVEGVPPALQADVEQGALRCVWLGVGAARFHEASSLQGRVCMQ